MTNESIILIAGTLLVGITIWKKPICEATLLLVMFLILVFVGLYLTVAQELNSTLVTKYWSVIAVLLGAFVGRISHGKQKPKNDEKKDGQKDSDA